MTFKAIAGKEDQAGGVAWRIKNTDNYYVARANALEDNVAIYHTINGRRTEKKRANMKVAPNVWHTLRADFQGRHFTVTYDGKTALEWDDDTFKDAGNGRRVDEGRQRDVVRRFQLRRKMNSRETSI